jgi:murein DD-endopeptidase MepM/ murein hydrolase activator NlpD
MSSISNFLRTDFHHLEGIEILQHSPEVLLGTTATAVATLKELEIHTVFDLASSRIFASASALTQAATQVNNPFVRMGTPPRDMVTDALASNKRVAELQFAEVGVLDGIGLQKQTSVQKDLAVRTVRDLSLYPPYLAAIQILNATFFPQSAPGFDPESPADLIPKGGEYPTERVQYTTLVLDTIADDGPAIDIGSETFKPINLMKALKENTGFKKVANGALLTFTQSWFVQGLTLGQLLHSTALAPGESTRMVVIDWSRRDSGNQSEQISESEDLTNDTSHNRSISEVTQAVATEAQSGFSKTSSFGSSSQSGGSGGLDLGFASFGGSASGASNSSEATSHSSSSGRRELSASMSQQINDRTHQHAHATRSRRASVVREVAQSEHEAVSSRVITNYNHMHALTIQYFEVVQVYRVEVQLTDAQRVVFIPVELIDFNDTEIVTRFRTVLSRVALNREIRDLLRNFDVIEVRPSSKAAFNFGAAISPGRIGNIVSAAPIATSAIASASISSASATAATPAASATTAPAASSAANVAVSHLFISPSASDTVRDSFWSAPQLSRLSNLLDRSIFRPRSSSVFLPSETVLIEANLTSNDTKFSLDYVTKEGKKLAQLAQPVALTDLKSINIKGSSNSDQEVAVVLTLSKNGVVFPLQFPAVVIPKNTPETIVMEFVNGGINANLRSHLVENRQHYSQAVFRSLSATEIAGILAGFSMKLGNRTVPVAQVIDPKPIGYVGNYIAFVVATDNTNESEDKVWLEFKKNRGIVFGKINADIIPLSSGGVFAEAVLGRANSAEKLDITRFWNWQDSPIPIQPTEIAAIQTGSRARDFETTPSQLSNPIVNITNPTALPDPQGMSAILSAIQNGNMFRDMSGLAQTTALAQAGLQASAAGAASAGSLAVQAQTVHLQAQVEKMKIAADLLGKVLTGGASGLAGGSGASGSSIGKNASTDGSLINFFDKQAGGASGGTQSAAPAQAASTGPATGNPPSNSTSRLSSGNPAADTAVFGPLGEPAGGILNRLVDSASNTGGGGTPPPDPNIETKTQAFDLPGHPGLDKKVTFTQTRNKTTFVSTFTATNNSHDFVELKFTLPTLTGMEVSPPEVETGGKIFVLPPQSKDTALFTIKPKANATTFAFELTSAINIGDHNATHTDIRSYGLPFESGKTFNCSQGFDGSLPSGTTSGATHTDAFNKFAVDLMLPNDTVVCAARGGTVVDLDESQSNTPGTKANFVRILHDDHTYGIYLHLNKDGVTVNLGDAVSKGAAIGKSGNSGQSSGAHLHFAVLKNDGSGLNSTQWGFEVDNGTDPLAGKDYTRA